MSKNIKGITIELGGSVQPLNKAMEDVNKTSRSLQSELREVERLLKFDPKNTDLLAQRQKLLAEQVDNSREKLNRLRAAQEQVNQQFAKGEISGEQYRAFQREVVKAEQDLKGFERQLKDTGMTVDKFGENLGAAGQKMTDVGKNLSMKVTAPIVAAGAASFKFAADLEDAMGASDQIFKDATDDIKSWANELDNFYGIAESEALTYANTMGAMLQNIGGLSEAEAAKQSKILVELAGDLTAMFGGTTESAVQALTGALKGNNSMLDNYGMGVNEATIKTKALEMGLISEGGQLDLAGKQAATLALIMEQTADAQGQAARESEGASGSLRGLTTELKNVAGELGQILIPVLTPLVAKIKEIVEAFGEMSPATQNTIVVIAGIAAAIGPLLIIFGTIASSVSAIIAALPVLGAAFGALTGPIGLVIAVIAGLVAAGVLLYKNWDTIKAKLSEVWGAVQNFFTVSIPNAINTGIKWFQELPGKIAEFMNQLPEKIGYAIGLALGKIVQFGIDAINWVVTEVPRFIEAIITFYAELPGKIWELLQAAYDKVVEWGVNLISWARSTIPNVISTIISFYLELPGKLREIGIDMIKGLWNGIQSMVGWIGEKISGFVDGIVAGFKKGMDIQSPSRVMADIGKNISLGLAEGMASAADAVYGAMGGLVGGVTLQSNLAAAGATTNYNSGGNIINITVQDSEDLINELHRRGIRI